MRHGRRNKKFDRHTAHRQAMLKNLARDLLIHESIKTTLAKAKEARRVVEKLITLGQVDTVKNRRLAYTYLQDKTLVRRLFIDIAPLFKQRPGGYTRLVKTFNRSGDGAPMVILGLVVKTEAPKHRGVRTKEQKEGKNAPSVKTETSTPERPKPQVKPVEKKTTPKQPHEQKKGIAFGLRKYFGGDKKGQ